MTLPHKKKIIPLIGLVLGLACLGYWINRLGIGVILHVIYDLKWYALLLLVNSFGWYLCYTNAWRMYFSNLSHSISFKRLLRIRICGEAITLMTPLGFVAGDPVRIALLEKILGVGTSMGSVIVDRLIHILASFIFIFTGILLTFQQVLPVTGVFRYIFLGVYFLLMSLILTMLINLLRGKKLTLLHFLLHHLRINKKYPQVEAGFHEFYQELKLLKKGRVSYFISSLIYHFIGRLLGATEISIIFYFLIGDPQWGLSVILASLTAVIHFMIPVVPGGVGVIESFYGFFFKYLHYPIELGITMQLIRRIRTLLWVGIGVFLLNYPTLKRWIRPKLTP